MATTTSTDNSSISKLHKPFKDHKDKTPKDLKDPKSAFRDSGWEPGKAPKESSRKPKENQPLREINPKMGFKQPKSLSKERRTEGISHASRLNKRLSGLDGDDHGTKRRKKGFVNSSEMPISELDGQSLDKKLLRDRSQLHTSKLRAESEDAELRSASTLPPFQDLVDANDSDVEDQSARSDVSKRFTVVTAGNELIYWLCYIGTSIRHIFSLMYINNHQGWFVGGHSKPGGSSGAFVCTLIGLGANS